MAITPLAGSQPVPIQPDNPQTRYGQFLGEVEHTGDIAGQPIGDTAAEAGSANESASALASAVAALTRRVEALEVAPPAHTHTQTDVSGLAVVLEDIRRRLSALENPPA